MWLGFIFFVIMTDGHPEVSNVMMANKVFESREDCIVQMMKDMPDVKWNGSGDTPYKTYGQCVRIGMPEPAPIPDPDEKSL